MSEGKISDANVSNNGRRLKAHLWQVFSVLHRYPAFGRLWIGRSIRRTVVKTPLALVAWKERSDSTLPNQQGPGLRRFMDKEERERAGHANLHLLADTLKIAITALLPFLLILVVVYERLSWREHIS